MIRSLISLWHASIFGKIQDVKQHTKQKTQQIQENVEETKLLLNGSESWFLQQKKEQLHDLD